MMNERPDMTATRVTIVTAATPGAVALIQLRGPNTPDYAKIFSRYDYAQLWTVGVKGTF